MIKRIAEHYGFKKQFNKAVEELGEVLVEISKTITNFEEGEPDPRQRAHLIEECVDSIIMLQQLIVLVHGEEEAAGIRKYKIDRQIERINKELSEWMGVK